MLPVHLDNGLIYQLIRVSVRMKKYIFNEFAKEKINYCSSSFDHSQTWKCEMKLAPILTPRTQIFSFV